MEVFIQGLLLGIAYVAPIGVQNLFVINTALTQRVSRTFLVVLIVLFFDITLALACFYGIGALIDRWSLFKLFILLIGGLVVMWIGIQLIRTKEVTLSDVNVDLPIWKTISTACVVTWFNPHAIVDGSMLLGAAKASYPEDMVTPFIFGVLTASALWFTSLAIISILFKSRLNEKMLRYLNIICGVIILFFGIKLLHQFYLLIQN